MFGRCCGRRRVGDGKQEEEEEAHTETWFVRALNRRLFRAGGKVRNFLKKFIFLISTSV